ncbi:uncharacterized protein LOC123398687 isoform X2 [Hordeum vulgare subsp. vulgare]|uniref:uncharacterized protein LOC123398687 isoform X2 n=1 Tax=Hordeum vulgare subsp. vulgare TaxID=112509 RepID=UPI001D1A54BE|nr:uncharacterized protein LOC123398687 isoform X2 [Hordeum vulgare subsp. vulgare]KAI4991329.1 hypothetical protein ZWY2020_039700 [Hordeum vulgare]
MTPGFGPGPQGSCDGVVRGPGLLLVKGGIACARRRRSKRRSRGSGVPSFAPGSSTFQCGTGAAATTDAKKLQQSHAHSCFTDYVLWPCTAKLTKMYTMCQSYCCLCSEND